MPASRTIAILAMEKARPYLDRLSPMRCEHHVPPSRLLGTGLSLATGGGGLRISKPIQNGSPPPPERSEKTVGEEKKPTAPSAVAEVNGGSTIRKTFFLWPFVFRLWPFVFRLWPDSPRPPSLHEGSPWATVAESMLGSSQSPGPITHSLQKTHRPLRWRGSKRWVYVAEVSSS